MSCDRWTSRTVVVRMEARIALGDVAEKAVAYITLWKILYT